MIAPGYLTPAEHAFQAESFVGWYDQSGHEDWRTAFAVWADSKDLQPGDRWAIASRAERILSRPVEVLTDVDAYFDFRRPVAAPRTRTESHAQT